MGIMEQGRLVADEREVSGIPSARLAMWWLLASEIVIFGGLLACYVLLRFRYPGWSEFSKEINTVAGATNTFVLLTSSLFAVLAHDAALKNDGKKAAKLLNLTVLFGFIFLGVKAFEYYTEIHHGFVLNTNVFWGFYYVSTAIHASHVIVGMIAMAIIASGAGKGQNLHRVELCGIYWHFVDIVWIFLFPLLYIAK
ncbi:MAG: heme/copper-type cytochrome/quinol oxidase subunit 3 [bacterium]|jgi:heme/copper-type cytochrome/quinol oxidase subunit 3